MRDSGVNEGENASGQGTRRVNSLDSRRKTRHERRGKGAHLRLEGMARRREGGDKDGAQAAATDEEQNRGLLSSSSHQPSIRAFLKFFHPTQQPVSRGPVLVLIRSCHTRKCQPSASSSGDFMVVGARGTASLAFPITTGDQRCSRWDSVPRSAS